ncbi:Ribosome biogenesis protein 1 [Clonorchis sinensis]|uniref:Ribosome biogenesis protein 1 n=1 Tax=Clonorchis sinensis TaxID=79923 RepID=A0A8T1MZ20_CLOSI|nr:Ribosome biogenesis protein 1 [Clonorchis sinensis]
MTQVDEYDFDSSDEEDIRNTIGNIPVQWYDSFAHIGYDTSGRPIIRPNFADGKSDSIDEFLQRVDTGMGESNLEWRTVQDPQTGQFVVLSDHDLDMVTKMASHKGVLSAGDSGPYEPWNDWFTKDVLEMPVTAHPPQKRSFIPSLLDRRRVGRMVHAIKMGWFKPRLPAWALSDPNDPDALRRYAAYMTSGNLGALDSDEEEDNLGIPSAFVSSYVFPDVWADQDSGPGVKPDECEDSWRTRFPMLSQDYRPPRPRPYQKAPEEPLPGHIASYNPPPEFILSKDEQKKLMKAWRERLYDGHVSRVPPQMPQKFDCLRHVPFSERYLREREERVKDLVMATRVEKQRLATTPEAILPQIPSLSQLRPYPSQPGLTYGGHRGRVTSLSISPCGQWLASISPADGYLRIWETSTNYCFRCYSLASPIESRPPPATKKISGSQKKSQQQQESTSDGEQEEQQPCDSDEEWSCERPTAVVVWNPKPELHLLAAAIGQSIFLINPALCDRVRVEQTNSGLEQWWTNRETEKSQKTAVEEAEDPQNDDEGARPSKKPRTEHIAEEPAHWDLKRQHALVVKSARSKTIERSRITVTVDQPVCSLDWHPKGDYLLSLSRPILSNELQSRSVRRLLLHRLSKMSSQSPFSSTSKAAEWRQAAFHPAGKPQLFVASSRTVRIYDLVQQRELRCLRLDSTGDFLSSMALHVSGEHLIVGTFDGRFNWFDIDLGNVPFKKLKLNHGAIRQLDSHRNRPLVSAAMDDGTLLILHATVSDDLLSKPVIIPVQLIRTGQPSGASTIFSTAFHTRQPHVYTGGADGSVRQFVAWR